MTVVTINSLKYEYWLNETAGRYFITVSNPSTCYIRKRKLVQGDNPLLNNVTATVDYTTGMVDINERYKPDETEVSVCDIGDSIL